MTHDDWRNAATRASVIPMYITATDTTGMNPNEYFACLGSRFGLINDIELLVVAEK
jgi:hypothetical protein